MSTDSSDDSKSTNLIDVTPEQGSASSKPDHSSSLRRLLIEQTMDYDLEMDDDDDEDEDDEDYDPLDS